MKQPRFYRCELGHDVIVQSWGTTPGRCPIATCGTELTEVTENGNPKRTKHEHV